MTIPIDKKEKRAKIKARSLAKAKAERAKWHAENPEKVLKRSDGQIFEMTDAFVAKTLGVRVKDCPPELLELKRDQLRIKSITKQLKQEIQND